MNEKLVLGPLLSVEGESKYVVCFLSKVDSSFSVFFDDKEIKAEKVADLKYGFFYRAEYLLKQSKSARTITYKISNTSSSFCRTSQSLLFNFFNK